MDSKKGKDIPIRNLIFITLLLLSSLAHASKWTVINVPGTICGDGKPYEIFYENNGSEKLLVEFMGGGACWDRDSCFGKYALFPWLHNYFVKESYSVFTSDFSPLNPFRSFSKLYFPYCTADIFAGNHMAQYEDKTVYHVGYKNTLDSFNYLIEKKIINFSKVKDLVVYGASAGGMAAFIHGKMIESFVKPEAKKTLIADSPGLHYGENFWEKFPEKLQSDFNFAFQKIGLLIDFNDGFVAKKMGPVFERYSNWNIGILQGLKDYIMSEVFGDISPSNHKKLVISDEGILAVSKNYPNVQVWLNDTYMHTFLLTTPSSLLIDGNWQTAIGFARDVYYQD